jgi:hypothetical protein
VAQQRVSVVRECLKPVPAACGGFSISVITAPSRTSAEAGRGAGVLAGDAAMLDSNRAVCPERLAIVPWNNTLLPAPLKLVWRSKMATAAGLQ